MDLKFKESKSEHHPGYGEGPGTIDTTIYYCPCEKGEVIYSKDNIPGFKESDWILDCTDCSDNYDISWSSGELTLKNQD